VWFVLDDYGSSVETSHDDSEATGEWTSEQGFDDRLIVG
jgi:hypothetical protein